MRAALCLAGLAGGQTQKIVGGTIWDGKTGKPVPVGDFRIALEAYRRHVFAHQDVDVFFHTWSTDVVHDLAHEYRPVAWHAQDPIEFDKPIPGRDAAGYKDGVTSMLNLILSRWYSVRFSVGLMRAYEQDCGFQYDAVMIGRFDFEWMTDVSFARLDMRHVYVTNWCTLKTLDGKEIIREDWYREGWHLRPDRCVHGHIGWSEDDGYPGIADLWFLSSSENMKAFADLYTLIPAYLQHVLPCNHLLALWHLRQLGLEGMIRKRFHTVTNGNLVRYLHTDWRRA